MNDRLLVIGATGAMGREVVRAYLTDEDNDWSIRMLTRRPEGRRSQALLEAGRGRVTAVKGDLDDTASLQITMTGVQRVFIKNDFFSSLSVQTECDQGVRALEVARSAEVEHMIYSSLDAAVSISAGLVSVPHYDAKAALEHWIDMNRSDEFMRREQHGRIHKMSVSLSTFFTTKIFSLSFRQDGGR